MASVGHRPHTGHIWGTGPSVYGPSLAHRQRNNRGWAAGMLLSLSSSVEQLNVANAALRHQSPVS